MCSSSVNPESKASKIPPQAILMILLIGGSFAADSFLRFPIPGINEPHYLSKAKHYWNPQWGSGDFFLESSNAHSFFYQVMGSLTQWLSLHNTALLGRLVAFLLLAMGWYRLVKVLVPGNWSPLITAWIYLGMVAIGNFSGEWIIGGIESKVFAYGFLFLSLASACEQHWNRAAIYAGLTISWHPVVGIWGVLCGGFSLVCDWYRKRRDFNKATYRQTLRSVISATGLLILCSLPGLIPSIGLLAQGNSEQNFAANYIQVFYRIKHHLDPMDFHLSSYVFYAILLAVWLILKRNEGPSFPNRFFQLFIVGTIGLACIGLLLGAGPRPASEMPYYAFRMSLLKFYPFRLFDALLPIAVTISIVNAFQYWLFQNENTDSKLLLIKKTSLKRMIPLFSFCIFISAIYSAWTFPPVHKMSPAQRTDWIDACRWIKNHTPETALFLTPTHQSDFKWYAQRPEYVTIKDCPQDAAGLIEWNRRLKYLRKWGQNYYNNGFDENAIRVLNNETKITHLLVKRLGPFTTLKPIYQNQTYKVYELP
ncbi:hypothetical protein V144x_24800 [Gimesia aquarii]|uniref:DUF6798 domain-containing protein n=1 Tax=Gimesia aquarii TaxID=2527964 RepID=A0A517VVJ8_9PLAN|nr:hypothetical protein V144x_24800 [Gimesia aquarii]